MLAEQLNKDYIQAMKGKEQLKVSTISLLRAQIKNIMIEKKQDSLEDADVIALIKKQVKQRQDSIEQYEKGGRDELAQKEKDELEILKSYLPEEMSEDQLKPIIADAIKESGASGMQDMGNVMKVVVPKVQGKADNKMVSALVKEALSQL